MKDLLKADKIDDARLMRAGEHLFNFAKSMGFPDDGGEGPLEYLLRITYETGWDDSRRSMDGTR